MSFPFRQSEISPTRIVSIPTGAKVSDPYFSQNLPQNHLPDLADARALVKSGNFDAVKLLYEDVPDTLSQLIRTAFIPKDGTQFYVSDFSAIEARVIAWYAGETWRQKVFETGGDIYCASASQMFHVPVEKHGINGHLRQKGKIAELALGYGGSVGALKAMGAIEMGLSEDELPPLVDAWRQTNPNIVKFWWDVDSAVMEAVKYKHTTSSYGLTFSCRSGMLFITLPSGRNLAYVKPKVGTNKFGGECITYEGIGSTKKWERLDSYGPKFVENIVQATSRDILCYAMKTLRCCSIVMHIHDELVIEADDYVCAEYKNHYRNSDNFLSADCLPVDCDNDHSEDPKDWITPADVLEAFPGVSLAIHYSRFNQREKNGKPARPKFHVLFPIDRVTDAALYSDMKKLVNSIFPYFDTKALDAARFFFGTQEPNVELYPGRMNLTDFFNDDEFDADLPGGHEKDVVIPEGSRNATMSRFAGIVIKKYGDTEKAYQSFLEKAATCVPPLDNSELNTIWHSAQRFFSKISREDGYVPPEVYNDENSYKPEDFSDVGQAEVLSKYFANELRYSPATHFIRYSDHYWQETEPGAQAVAHELTRRQLAEANRNMMEALQKLKNCGAQEILDNTSKAKAEQLMSDEQMEAYQEFLAAKLCNSSRPAISTP